MPAPGQVNAGERVRITRAEQGLSQAQLAARAGVDPSTVSALETGRRWPRAEQQVRIEKALGWQPGTLERLARGWQPGEPEPPRDPFAEIDAVEGLTDAERAAYRALSDAFRAAREAGKGSPGDMTA